jgi:O-antigen/teichoic acid export membrane protein
MPSNFTEDSFKKRYLFKLSSNLVGVAISAISSAVIPRGLGPRAYGDYSFLTSFFSQLIGFFDMGTSNCFYTKLSQRQQDTGLIYFYTYFTSLTALVAVLFVTFSHHFLDYSMIWPDQALKYIYMALFLGILTWIVGILTQIGDAFGLTVSMEKARICQRAIGVILILLLFISNQLQLTQFFIYNYLVLLGFGVALIWIFERARHSFRKKGRLSWVEIKAYAKEFYSYSNPLFLYSLVGLVAGIMDRWLLQRYAGSIQQGFYGLSYQVGTLCFLFTGAMTPLLTREFSIAFSNNDLDKMASLFRRYIPMLYAISAFFSCFIAVQADKITILFGGDKFEGAVAAVIIMSFYPLLQTYGQLSGSVFYATGQTALYRNIGVSLMVVGLPITYFLIAPTELWGLQAGSAGLALKTVFIAFVAINIQLYFNARFLRLHFGKLFLHQLYTVILFLLVSWVALVGTAGINNLVLSFLSSGFIYSLGCIGLVLLCPSIISMSRHELKNKMDSFLSMLWKAR